MFYNYVFSPFPFSSCVFLLCFFDAYCVIQRHSISLPFLFLNVFYFIFDAFLFFLMLFVSFNDIPSLFLSCFLMCFIFFLMRLYFF